MGVKSIDKYLGEFKETDGCMNDDQPKTRSCQTSSQFSSQDVVAIKYFILKENKGAGTTLKSIQNFLATQRNIKVSCSTLQRFLTKDLGFTFGKMKGDSKLKYKEKHAKKIRAFLIQYSQAQKLEREGTHVIV